MGRLVTGVVCAAVGREAESGKFETRGLLFALPPPQPERPIFQQDR